MRRNRYGLPRNLNQYVRQKQPDDRTSLFSDEEVLFISEYAQIFKKEVHDVAKVELKQPVVQERRTGRCGS